MKRREHAYRCPCANCEKAREQRRRSGRYHIVPVCESYFAGAHGKYLQRLFRAEAR